MKIFDKDPVKFAGDKHNATQRIVNIIGKLKVGQTVLITRKEWKDKTPPIIVFYSAQRRKKYQAIKDIKITTHTSYLPDGFYGWYIKRIK